MPSPSSPILSAHSVPPCADGATASTPQNPKNPPVLAVASPEALASFISNARLRRDTAAYGAIGLIETLLDVGAVPERFHAQAADVMAEFLAAQSDLEAACYAQRGSTLSTSLYALAGKSPDDILRAMEDQQ